MRVVLGIVIAVAAWGQAPVDRALGYLSAEVPKWRTENGCFSCHNNGDGARALYAAGRLTPLKETNEWLSTPAKWDKGRLEGTNSDKRLARMQFAVALAAAVKAGAITDRTLLVAAAESLLPLQTPAGAWEIEDEGEAAGSPVTWGTMLSTSLVARMLRSMDAARFGPAIARAEQYLRKSAPRYTPDVVAVLLTFPSDKQLVERLASTQTTDGGWGAVPKTPAEAFDTALALIALSAADPEHPAIARGREFLIRTQLQSGGWTETTRPAGSQSYAQHISTTAWATMALLETQRN